ncbi:MAG TPA: hypothetical protein PKC30_13340 [Saprospiraceae bacterium]|nr:hypothetical protein [Saprospiraceae bacterium]
MISDRYKSLSISFVNLLSGLLLLLILLSSCKTNPPYTPGSNHHKAIVIGTGGGITGRETSWHFVDNGSVFRFNELHSEFTYLGKWDQRISDQFFSMIEEGSLDSFSINDPGNIYSFLRFYSPGKNMFFTWGGENEKAPELLLSMYTNLRAIALRITHPQ